ncbi:hypothetical protein cypCar_00005157 [Cyprinus carpio]|nr:hypothetical protein cypCar_00005157 [Cyprinus carpio]
MEELMNGLNLVLLGKQGDGKSATGDTILGRKAFKSKKTSESVTEDMVEESGTVSGLQVTIHDTPGFSDIKLKENDIQQKYESIFQKCESGPCAFLLVVKAARFTEEDRKTVEKIEKLLGQERLQKTWILFTRGDQLEDENLTINELINENEHLKKLLQKYDQRYHVFNNKKKGHSGQVTLLLAKILKTCLKKTEKGDGNLEQPPPNGCKLMSKNANESIRMVLLGETGAGKSAAGNTILGQKVFKSAVTNKCLKKRTTVAGRIASVVDTPDFFDSKKNPEQLVRETARSIYSSRPGPHAFLIAFPANMRFTEHEGQILQMVQILFGEDALKYSIIVFTHGDQLEGGSIERLIERNCALRHLVQQCGDRYHVLNNKNSEDREQVNHLLLMIDRMIEQNGGYYTNEMFKDSQQGEEQLTQRRRRKITRQRNSGYSFLSGDGHNNDLSVVVVSVATGVGLGAVCGAPAIGAAFSGAGSGAGSEAGSGAGSNSICGIIVGAVGGGVGGIAGGVVVGGAVGGISGGVVGGAVGGISGGVVGGVVGGGVGGIAGRVVVGGVVGGIAGGVFGGAVGGGVGGIAGGVVGGGAVGGIAGGVVSGAVGGIAGGVVGVSGIPGGVVGGGVGGIMGGVVGGGGVGGVISGVVGGGVGGIMGGVVGGGGCWWGL